MSRGDMHGVEFLADYWSTRKAQVPIKSKGLGLWLPALQGSKHTLSPAISKAVIP
ncbi:hypothetical protein J6590_063101 [Homalodisca vitripennis]|nr:hypothetical protein J6590_063101 [Homalodisca vitripennis]